MNNETNHSFSSVVSINPYKNTYLSGRSSFLSEVKSAEYRKEQFAISYLNSQGFINSQISISKNIPEEDLFDAINNKIYDELGLDQAVTYQIQFIESVKTLDESNRTFNVFIVDPSSLEETYNDVVKKIKYIDIIIPTPLLIKSLYSKSIIESMGVHCFVYFQENDASVTVYDEHEFVFTKSIKYSIKQMHERFCEIHGERIDYIDFIDFLTLESLKDTLSEYKPSLIKLYKEIFSNINDILTYVKRAFEIEKIETVYIGSQLELATLLDEMAEVELKIKSEDFDFKCGYTSELTHVDQLHALMHLYTTIDENEKYLCNFTIYHRPPKFIKRESGKLILVTAASIFLAFLYPITYWSLGYGQQLRFDMLTQEYNEIHNIRTTREATINNTEAEKAKFLALLKTEDAEYYRKKATLIKIHEVKVNYPMKAKLIHTLTQGLNKFNVQLEKLNYDEDTTHKVFSLGLVSSKDKEITQLVEYFTKTYEKEFMFSIEEILYQDESKKYFGELKVELL
ncbi:MAG: hypothetical protein RBR59_06620 [Sulfurimonadaceae bacterium]|jgi:hypothetical protein|nr:hypothetical protein [Sulfurimonadaceae bacterium]